MLLRDRLLICQREPGTPARSGCQWLPIRPKATRQQEVVSPLLPTTRSLRPMYTLGIGDLSATRALCAMKDPESNAYQYRSLTTRMLRYTVRRGRQSLQSGCISRAAWTRGTLIVGSIVESISPWTEHSRSPECAQSRLGQGPEATLTAVGQDLGTNHIRDAV